MRKISLTQGKFALVDGELFDYLNQWKWYACEDKSTGSFYAYRHLRKNEDGGKYTKYAMHRQITGYKLTDHINRNTLDNRKENLREASRSENTTNSPIRKNNKSGFKGVWSDKSGSVFRSKIFKDGKSYYLGTFQTAELAHEAYCEAAKRLHGEFCRFK